MVHSTAIVLLFIAYKLQVTWNKKALRHLLTEVVKCSHFKSVDSRFQG